MSPNAPDPPDDDIPVQVGVASDVVNDDQDGLTTVLSVSGGQVEFAAKGSLVTPMGCANRCRIRVLDRHSERKHFHTRFRPGVDCGRYYH